MQKGHHGLGIAGFILSLVGVQPLALIFSIIGLVVGKRNGNKTGLAIAGLVISIVSMVVEIIIFFSIGPMLMEMINQIMNSAATALAIL